MEQYRTAMEKASEWGITVRDVQRLCKSGKIAGAVKRGGAWLIPAEAPHPSNQCENQNDPPEYTGTKRVLFEAAAELIGHRPFESIAPETIAAHVGIDVSEFYKHFASMESVLQCLYDYYRYNCVADRPTLEELEPVLRDGSVLNIVNCVNYAFDESHFVLMVNVHRIIFHRMFVDERARALAEQYQVKGAIDYVDKVFRRAIELGRFPPFDTRSLAFFCNSITTFVFVCYSVNTTSDYLLELHRLQLAVNEHCANYLEQLLQPSHSRSRLNPRTSPDRMRTPRGRH